MSVARPAPSAPRSASGARPVARLLLLWATAAIGVGAVCVEVLVAVVALLGGTDAAAVVDLGARTLPVATLAAIALVLLRRRGRR